MTWEIKPVYNILWFKKSGTMEKGLNILQLKVKQSHYRPGVAQRVQGN
jgi:hypothetical protein